MKRFLFIMTMVAAATVVASMAFAATTFDGTHTSSIGGASFIPSTGVTLYGTTDAAGIYYTSTCQHSSSDPTKGGVQWGSTNGTSTILKKTANTNGLPDTPPTAASGAVLTGFN